MVSAKVFVALAVCGMALAAIPLELHCTGECQLKAEGSIMEIKQLMTVKQKERDAQRILGLCPQPTLKRTAEVPCVNGKAGEYECSNTDLMSFIPLADMGTANSEGNDCWGWTDANGREIAIMALTDGSSFVDISEPTNPVILGYLPSAQPGQVIWRDIKVYQNHAFIVSEHRNHGMQVFDLTRLPSADDARKAATVPRLTPDNLYDEFGSCHNIVINEESGFAYGVGTTTCRGGLHMVDIRDPKNPKFAGCYADDGYCHDAECVIYRGPDSRYTGKEICFAYNEDSLTIVDVTTKSTPVLVSRVMYEGYAYTHQGWLTGDQKYLLLDDELDEVEQKNNGHTKTYIWDVIDLKQPRLVDSFASPATAIDHNQYIIGDLSYQANYEAGLRILNISSIADGKLTEAGYFDVRPESTEVQFFGSWSVYPFFKSGNVVVSSIERGMFIVRPQFQPNRAALAMKDVVVREDTPKQE